MNALLIISIILVLLFLGIALLRIRMIIDSTEDRYEISILPLARVKLLLADDTIGYCWRAAWLQGKGHLFPSAEIAEDHKYKKEHQKKERNGRRKSKMDLKDMSVLVKRIWHGLEVKRFFVRLNTDDPLWNAWLFPVFSFWRAKGYDVGIQFMGNSTLVLEMEHSVHRIAGAFIHMYLTKR